MEIEILIARFLYYNIYRNIILKVIKYKSMIEKLMEGIFIEKGIVSQSLRRWILFLITCNYFRNIYDKISKYFVLKIVNITLNKSK